MKKWRCEICGYVHEGDTPPESCPICGVGPDEFVEIKEEKSSGVKKWRCKICGYIHEGDTPPEECPICGVGPDEFEPVEDTEEDPLSKEEKDRLQTLLFNLSYGLYIITSKDGEKLNGMTSNSFIQVTDSPLRGSVCINKATCTSELIHKSGVFGVSVIGKNNHDLVAHFGFQTGHRVDKFAEMEHVIGKETGCPGLPQTLCFIELKVEKEVDLGTHTMFIGRVVGGESFKSEEPMTYAYYRATK
ncbi:MAG: flavin reductase [Eubacterium sp.]|nr:flavin reductase [Eubacterium sp.]